MVGVANTKETNDKFVEKLAAKYKIKVIGELYMLLGMHITPDYENHTINPLYPPDINEFGMEDVNTVAMPMHPNVIQHDPNDGLAIKEQNRISYAVTSVNCWMQYMPRDPISYTRL